MKIAMAGVGTDSVKDVAIKVKEKLESQYRDIVVELMEVLPVGLKLEAEDLLVTFDLSGFERQTLTGSISYNLLNCRQIHILLNDKLPCEKRLAMPLSISMFFFCKGHDYYKYLSDAYPDIPYLQVIDDWSDENSAAILMQIVEHVGRMCHLFPYDRQEVPGEELLE